MLCEREIREFWNRTTVEDGCWPWMGATLPTGYGFFTRYTEVNGKRRKKTVYAHRFSYELHHGEIPKGAIVMHSCDNPGCVNPAHLSTGTYQDNLEDMAKKGRHPTILPLIPREDVPLYYRLRMERMRTKREEKP